MAASSRIEELRRRIVADPASIVFAQLGEEYRRAGHYLDAVEVCRTGLERYPGYISARVTLGRALMELGELDAASRELEMVVGTAPDNLAAIRALADIHQRKRDLPGALDYFDKAQALTPSDPEIRDARASLSEELRATERRSSDRASEVVPDAGFTPGPFSLDALDAMLGGTETPVHVEGLLSEQQADGWPPEAPPSEGFVVTDLAKLPDAEPSDDPLAALESGLRSFGPGGRERSATRSAEEVDRAVLSELERWLEALERGEG